MSAGKVLLDWLSDQGATEPMGDAEAALFAAVAQDARDLVAQRDTLLSVESINADTITTQQKALREAESQRGRLAVALRDVLADLKDAEDNAESFLVLPSPDCRDCTCGVSPKDIMCARHRAERALAAVTP